MNIKSMSRVCSKAEPSYFREYQPWDNMITAFKTRYNYKRITKYPL